MAGQYAKGYRTRGMEPDAALMRAANEWLIDAVNTLANFCEGRRGSSRRLRKRARP